MKTDITIIKEMTIKEVKEYTQKLKGEIDGEMLKNITASYPQFYKNEMKGGLK